MIKIGENILESSKTNFMNLSPYIFDEDYVVKIRSELSITVPEKKTEKNYRKIRNKSDLSFYSEICNSPVLSCPAWDHAHVSIASLAMVAKSPTPLLSSWVT